MRVSWLDQQVSLYRTHSDNVGRPVTMREALFTAPLRNRKIIEALRSLDRQSPTYQIRKRQLKSRLQCFTPSGLLKSKKAGYTTEISRTGLVQLDFDHQDISEYDLLDLKKSVFSLPFITYCGLSCSGDGFYALALISDPYKMSDYADHMFDVFANYGMKVDRSKGKKVENLRYVSYDTDMLYREAAEALCVTNFKAIYANPFTTIRDFTYMKNFPPNGFIKAQLNKIKNATIGNRWTIVQKVAYTLGGIGDICLMDLITNEIKTNPQFDGFNAKYIKCAKDCFRDGLKTPLKNKQLPNNSCHY